MSNYIDKELLRKSLKDLVVIEPEFVSALLSEIDNDLKNRHKQRLSEIVDEDFKEYGDVFKALA